MPFYTLVLRKPSCHTSGRWTLDPGPYAPPLPELRCLFIPLYYIRHSVTLVDDALDPVPHLCQGCTLSIRHPRPFAEPGSQPQAPGEPQQLCWSTQLPSIAQGQMRLTRPLEMVSSPKEQAEGIKRAERQRAV
ncbi:hypothetical protein AOLI_G00191340 [Acnodon oligacanthus]